MADSFNNLKFNRPPLFTPNFVRGLQRDSAQTSVLEQVTGADFEDTTLGVSSSFKYDTDEIGLKNTQQLNIGWDKFENHTFFNSAQVKTNVAFDYIINNFPFDGTQAEYETFFEKLTGFEKYVYDLYPKNIGYGFFSGSNLTNPNNGTWITVKDIEGAQYEGISKGTSGVSKLNPETKSTEIEVWINFPQETNEDQSVISKMNFSGGLYDGFSLNLSSSSNANTASLYYSVVSKSVSKTIGFTVPKGEWVNLVLDWDRTPTTNKLLAYNGSDLITSSSSFEFGQTFWAGSDLVIGSGSAFIASDFSFTPKTTLSGSLDELRIWHKVREKTERELTQRKGIFAQENLQAYYKFNEPSGSNSYLTLDSSGKSLHGSLNIVGNMFRVREISTGSLAGPSPMFWEKIENAPVLFPGFPEVETLREDILSLAASYDENNPNLITKLIPPHYLQEGQELEGLTTELDGIEDLNVSSDPKSARLGSSQLILSLLYVWAKYFDEMKLYIQNFSNLNWVDYDSEDTTPDQFLQALAKQQGFDLPPLFTNTSIEQYISSENIQGDISTNEMSLQFIQNQIWRRVLINLRDITKSKGTIHSVKSFIRSVGIDPDNTFRIREFGGPTKAPLTFVRDSRSEIASMMTFISGGLITSPFLSGSRTEPGYPEISVAGQNGWFTSGSWTYEGTYKFSAPVFENSQSLFRLHSQGDSTFVSGNVICNLVAVSSSQTVNFYARPNASTDAPYTSLQLTGVNIWDGNKWYVSVGRRRSDDVDMNSVISSSYFLRVARADYGEIVESYFDMQYLNESSGSATTNLFETYDEKLNASGSFIVIGSGSLEPNVGAYANVGLNATFVDTTAKASAFEGKLGQVRFWSKYLGDKEWPEHVQNFKSLGVQNPLSNFNFVTTNTGSFEKLRIDVSTDQQETETNASGEITGFDFSQNLLHMSGTSFPVTQSVVVPEKFYYTYISPKFDEGTSTDKVRARSFLNYSNVVSSSYAQVAPLYQIELNEQPTDNTRFSIDFSIVDSLDQDIVGIFSTLDSLDNILGNPELAFSPDYPNLDNLRSIYFNRLTGKMNLKGFFEFYKWFDTNIGTFISQLIPRKTKYLGTGFLIESHVLERPKVEYYYSDIYLGDSNRQEDRVILLQLISGEFSRL